MQVNIILLGAGKGQRFQSSSPNQVGCGTIKQLAQINGKPLITHSVDKLQPLLTDPSVNSLYVTLGANKNAIQAVLPQGVSVIASQHWSDGMGHTLAESVHSIKAQSSHVLIALADQALITTEHYQALLDASNEQPNKVIATLCDDQLMAPAIFPEKYFPLLVKLQGDKGAGKLLLQHAKKVDAIHCNQAKIDIDTLSDLERVREHLQSSLPNESL
ncbi:nucleotidyltransferase family protein [Colwellia sp. 12G3]|uniref:nucleotidyltransferase family protein n=1 Tax=Colwellia sp. 12G3 TaxID=2058299 RepID=UPI000C346A44|nr:nucleotidyltransferase family protein [Colwellia sp. 12G3]PKI15836.1 nucleotidyltransferase family protein [Colwellia sp. 12G3]